MEPGQFYLNNSVYGQRIKYILVLERHGYDYQIYSFLTGTYHNVYIRHMQEDWTLLD